MGRDYYRQIDKDNEDKFKQDLEALWDKQIEENPKYYPVDFGLYGRESGRLLASIELKTRTFPSTTYSSAMITLTKVISFDNILRITKRPVVYAARYTDKDLFWTYDPSVELEIRYAGRPDRPQDWQPHCFIPIKSFREAKEIGLGRKVTTLEI